MRDHALREAEARADEAAVKQFVASLEAFVDRVDALAARNGGDLAAAQLHATANGRYCDELLQSVQVNAQLSTVALVPEGTLRRVVQAMVARVHAAALCAAGVSVWPPPKDAVCQIELGIRAACIVLALLAAPDVHRGLFIQDTLDELLLLLRSASVYIVYPACDPLYAAPRRSSEEGDDANDAAGDGDGDACDGGDKGLLRSRAKLTASKPIERLLQSCCVMYDMLSDMVARERGLADSFVTQVLSLCSSSLGVDGIVPLQMSACKVTEAVAASYPDQDWAILEDLREQLSKVPPNRRSLRAYRVDGGSTQVRVGSALLVKVLNIAGGRMETPARDALMPTPGDAPDELRRRVMRLAFRFVDELLERTFRDRDAEHRAALQALFADLLELFALPEWPSAELIVQALGLRLVIMLNKGGDLSVQARVIALDMLGALAARICVLHGDSALQASSSPAESVWQNQSLRRDVLEKRVLILAYLRDQAKTDASCGYAQLFHCAQFVLDDADAFQALHKAKGAPERAGVESTEAVSGVDVSCVRRAAMEAGARALAETLQSLRGTYEGDRVDAVAAALFVSKRRTFSRQLSKIVDTIRDGLQRPEPTLRSKAIKMLSVIAEAEPAVLRNVPSLLSAVEASCMDVSKSVREASLDLLCRSVSAMGGAGPSAAAAAPAPYGADFFEKVFPIVQQRLLDSATSVRKRAITIMHRVLMDAMAQLASAGGGSREAEQRLDRVIIRVCCTLVDRLDDREVSVRESADRTLRLALFGFDPAQLADAPSRAQDEAAASMYAARLVAMFLATINNQRASATQWNVVSHVLHEAVIVKRRPLLVLIAGEVVEILHGTEARLAEATREPAAGASGLADAEAAGRRRRDADLLHRKRLACSSTLEALAKVDPTLGAPHCQALAPYIKGIAEVRRRHPADLLNIARVLSVLEMCTPIAGRSFDCTRLDEMVRDVDRIVCMCPAPSIAPPAIKCLCVLAKHAQDPELRSMPEATSRMFYDFLAAARDELAAADGASSSESVRNAKQALPRLGLLARYGEFDEKYTADIYAVLEFLCVGMMGEWMVGSRASAGVRTAAAPSPPPPRQDLVALRLGAVRSLMYFLTRHRSYLPKATPLLVACLRQGRSAPDFEAQLAVLTGLQEMLVEEECRNVTQAEKAGKEVNRAKPGAKGDLVLAAEEDAEAGFLALCAQALVPELHDTSRSSNPDVRKAVVTVLGLLARQGLVLPANIVPALFGFLVDGNAQCRESALFVVGFLADRHPGMLSSAAMAGVRSTYSHAMLTRPRRSEADALEHIYESAVDCKTGYALLSPALVQIQRDQRRGVLCGMVREFDPRAKTVKADAAGGVAGAGETSAELPDGTRTGGAGAGRAPSGAPLDDGLGEVDDGDDDVVTNGVVKLRAVGTSASMSNLAFFAATLATMDYAAGSGVGGSLTAGGGTAAAEAKLRAGRDDVADVTGVVSRIVSNSGQAVLEAVKHVLKPSSGAGRAERTFVARQAAPLCLLLMVKRFLKEVRWFLEAPDRDEDDAGADAAAAVPHFDMSRLPRSCLSASSPHDASCEWSAADADAQLLLFRELMRDDSIDEADVEAATGRKSVSRRKGVATTMRRKTGGRTRATGGGGHGRRVKPATQVGGPGRVAAKGVASGGGRDDGVDGDF
jgi:hypothetical protein